MINDNYYIDNYYIDDEFYIDNFPGYLAGIICFGIGYYFILHLINKFCVFTVGDKTSWFLLHAVTNTAITYNSYDYAIQFFNDPSEINEYIVFDYVGLLGAVLHLYHCLNYKLTLIDKMHHIFSVFLCVPLALYNGKRVLYLYYFFGTGLPGGIDYYLLCLVKKNIIHPLTEKKINAAINAYLRMPGLFITSFLIYQTRLSEQTGENRLNVLFNIEMPQTVDWKGFEYYSTCLLSFLIFLNSAYFGNLAIYNYSERKALQYTKCKNT